jgi:hypothetical protein
MSTKCSNHVRVIGKSITSNIYAFIVLRTVMVNFVVNLIGLRMPRTLTKIPLSVSVKTIPERINYKMKTK